MLYTSSPLSPFLNPMVVWVECWHTKCRRHSIRMGGENQCQTDLSLKPVLPFLLCDLVQNHFASESVPYLTQRGPPRQVGKELTIMWRKVFWLAHGSIIFVQKWDFRKCNSLNLQMQHMSQNWHPGLPIYLVLDPDPGPCHYSLVSQKAIIFWTSLETPPHALWQVHLVHTKAHYLYLYYWTQGEAH